VTIAEPAGRKRQTPRALPERRSNSLGTRRLDATVPDEGRETGSAIAYIGQTLSRAKKVTWAVVYRKNSLDRP
jgi:hypothetical protein